MKTVLKKKTMAFTGLIAAIAFFISGAALARMDMSFLQNLSFRMPDEQAGRTVPFIVKGITLYLTTMQAAWTKGLMLITIVTLGILAATFFMIEQAKKENR